MPPDFLRLLASLGVYALRWSAEAAGVENFRDFLQSGPTVFERRCDPGHFTGSAWLVSADGAQVADAR